MHSDEGKEGVKVCVTGAGGYIGSWMVKSLLQRGYIVNATFRNPENGAKMEPLLALPGAAERLRLFKADLCEEGTFNSAVEGCDGVFHLASPMVTSNPLHEEDYVEPAVKGLLNVLNSCLRSKSMRHVVYTSSVVAAYPLNEEGEIISGYYLDESIWIPVDFLRRKQHLIHVHIVMSII